MMININKVDLGYCERDNMDTQLWLERSEKAFLRKLF